MTVLCQPEWRDGQFLRSQGFQFWNANFQDLSRQVERNAHPYFWGGHYTIDEPAFQRGTLKFEQAEIVMQDGSRLCLQGPPPKSNICIKPREFIEALDAHGKPLGVYLGLKPVPWVEPLYQHYTYTIQESEVVDLYAADNRSPVSYLIYVVQIIFENEIEQYRDWATLKVARIKRSSHGQGFQLNEHYIPPCRAIQTSGHLMKILESLRDLLQRKAHELLPYKQHRGVRVRSMEHREVLQILSRYYQSLQHAIEARATHPHDVYGLLRQLVGEISPFFERYSELNDALPTYRHDQLWTCFDAIVRCASQLLCDIPGGPVHEMLLSYDSDSKSYRADIGRPKQPIGLAHFLDLRVRAQNPAILGIPM